jgi:phosphoglycolate phosphatase-like HAD superfamily hydrolase
MVKLIIFDWDDVITLGAKDGYYQCYRKTLKEFNIVFEEKELHERIQRKWGQPFREVLRELLFEHPELLDKATKIFDKKFWGNTFVDSLKGVESANRVLENLSKKYKLAVATGNHPTMLKEKIIPKFHIPEVFVQIITAFDIPIDKTKPNPYMLEQIMEKQEVKPEECVYVGDAENDVLMAQNACVEPIVVLTGHLNKEKAEKLGVKKIFPDITYLEQIL